MRTKVIFNGFDIIGYGFPGNPLALIGQEYEVLGLIYKNFLFVLVTNFLNTHPLTC